MTKNKVPLVPILPKQRKNVGSTLNPIRIDLEVRSLLCGRLTAKVDPQLLDAELQLVWEGHGEDN